MDTRTRLATGALLAGMLIGGSLGSGTALIRAAKGGHGQGQAAAHGRGQQGAHGRGHQAGTASGTGATVTGYLAAEPIAAAPGGTALATLTITTSRGQVAVQVTASTRYLGSHDGLSSYRDLLPSDHLQVTGWRADAQTIVAGTIMDLSVGGADTVLAATVTGVVTAAPQTVTVLPQPHGHRAAFGGGQTAFTLPISPTTVIIAGGVARQGDDSALATGNRISVVGVFDRHSRTFSATKRIVVRGDTGARTDDEETTSAESTSATTGAPGTTTTSTAVGTTSTSTVTALTTTTVTVGTTTTSTTTVQATTTGTTSTGSTTTGTTTTGTTTTGTTSTGTTSAQGVFVQVSGIVDKVTATGTGSATVSVHLHGDTLAALPVTAATVITVGSNPAAGTLADVKAGKFVVALATYDPTSNAYTSVSSLNVQP